MTFCNCIIIGIFTISKSLIIKHCKEVGYNCLSKLGKGRLNAILSKSAIKPHKISYYIERRDPEFEEKMANLLCLYKVKLKNYYLTKNKLEKGYFR